MENIDKELERMKITKYDKDVLMKNYTTYRVGGKAKYIAYPKNVDSLVSLIEYLKNNNIKYKIIGNGSNLLFSDRDYDGVLIKLSEFDEIKFIGKDKVRVGAGYNLIKLSLVTAKKSLTGLEFASGIPGTVGGSVFMNAGAYKSDMGYVVESVKVLTPDLNIINLENKEMNFHYRTSFLKTHPDYICLEVVFKLNKGEKEVIEDLIRERRQRRLESQPLEYPSAGSVFRNPTGDFAGRLIEESGLKGKKHGGAMISDKHANFVINYKNATADDIKYLIDMAHQEVKENYDIDLKVEQEFVNWE